MARVESPWGRDGVRGPAVLAACQDGSLRSDEASLVAQHPTGSAQCRV